MCRAKQQRVHSLSGESWHSPNQDNLMIKPSNVKQVMFSLSNISIRIPSGTWLVIANTG